MDGVLVVDKPSGPTSHDVVARVRHALRTKRIGHTGTLDPLATGVLPLVIGRATRLASLLSGADKEYVAAIRLGLATDTYDGDGHVGPPPGAPAGVDFTRLEAALDPFRGIFDQAPPAYSAKKIAGVAAYKLARRNMPVQPRPVSVHVSHLSLEAYEDGLARVRVRASAGFYVRSLAHDLGQALGCGGYLETLRRVRAGAFGEEVAIPLDTIDRDGTAAARLIIPMERLLTEVPSVVLNERGIRRAAHGNELALEDRADPRPASGVAIGEANLGRLRLLDGSGMLLGIAELRPGGLLHPVIVLV